MPSQVETEDIELCLRELLTREGFSLSPTRLWGETGVDIIASKEGDHWHIKAIGYESSGPARASHFYESFFRAISRLDDGAQHVVVAMPAEARGGIPAHAMERRDVWQRIGRVLPGLEIWLVDTDGRRYERTSWTGWLR